MRWFWVPHFVFVKDRSLEGTRLLEEAYLRESKIDESALPGGRRGKATVLLLLPALAGAALLLWFYLSYVRQRAEELAPGVYAVFGGGGNSLVVLGGGRFCSWTPSSRLPPGGCEVGSRDVVNA